MPQTSGKRLRIDRVLVRLRVSDTHASANVTPTRTKSSEATTGPSAGHALIPTQATMPSTWRQGPRGRAAGAWTRWLRTGPRSATASGPKGGSCNVDRAPIAIGLASTGRPRPGFWGPDLEGMRPYAAGDYAEGRRGAPPGWVGYARSATRPGGSSGRARVTAHRGHPLLPGVRV